MSTTTTKRASLREGIEWIALNDEAYYEGTFMENVRRAEGQISVALLADLFGKDTEEIARAVVRYRVKHGF